jgi:LPXTG-motif cell wall-anchored protein
MHIIGDVNMKRENNKKFKKRKRNQNRSLTCRVLSMMFAIVLFCSTVLINTDYVSQASSFDDMVDMVEVEEDSAAVDISEETGDDLGTDVNFESEESTDETYSESDDLGSSDADFSSGENMFTDGTSESSAPAEEAAQPVSCIVNLKNETIEVKAEAPAGVLPNGTQMIVKAVENNTEDAELTDQYNKLAAKITEQLQNQGKNLDGFLAYNVSFTDADGNPVEPSDKVTYSFTYKEASSPELTDPAASTVTAAMIRTNKETSELELTELKAEEDKLTVETNESRQLTKAAFQSAATAAYTFVWSSTPAADDNENTENKEENSEVNNEEVNADTNTENTEENGEETNTENNVENSEEEQNPEEAPDQEQIKMIRITADEVNLRVSPSTEADVIATVDTDTQLPLIETVTGEDEFTWYKVSYEEAEAYVRSDMAEVVENEEQGTENEDANEEEADVQVEDEVTYSQTIGNVVVTATAAKDVLPGNAEFVVTPIVQETDPDQYAETETKLNEKAEEDGYEIAGFLAYDIYFQDNGGNKIEPVDGSVNVSMHYTEPSVPEEVAQASETENETAVLTEEDELSQEETAVEPANQMAVTMMHLVEDEDGNVNVVDMTQEGTASVETDEVGSVQKAEFVTDKFSVFALAWQDSLDLAETRSTTVEVEDDIVNSGALKATCTSDSVKNYTWYRNSKETGEYTKVDPVNYNTGSEIKTNISQDQTQLFPAYDNGEATGARQWYYVEVELTNGEKITSDPIQVTYFKELQNGGFENLTATSYSNQYSNEYYKEENGVWQTTGIGTGNKKNCDIEIVRKGMSNDSSSYAWNKVSGKLFNNFSDSSSYTPTDGSYEDGHDWANAAYEGNQFAELNCEESGALYQDVLTKDGTALNYWLSHRARGKYGYSSYRKESWDFYEPYYPNANVKQYDTMFLVMMPTKTAIENNLTTQDNLKNYLASLHVNYSQTATTEENEVVYNQNGIKILRITSSNQKWHYILATNDYIPTSSLTRFFFMAGTTAAGSLTEGNFLDQVGFSQELPPVADDEYSIEINKNFSGLSSTQINNIKNNLKFEISVTDNGQPVDEATVRKLFGLDENAPLEISGSSMTSQPNGNLKYSLANKKIAYGKSYTVTLTEKGADLAGYQLKTTTETKVKVGDAAEPTTPNTTTSNTTTFTLTGKTIATISFTNAYEAANKKKVNFTKVWDDNNNTWNTRPANLTVTLKATYDVEENGQYVTKELTAQDLGLDSLDQILTDANKTDDNKWKCTWEVPVYKIIDLDTGLKVKIDYTVVEGNVDSEYVYTSPSNGKAVSGNGSDYETKTWNANDITTPGSTASADSTGSSSEQGVLSRVKARAVNMFGGDDTPTVVSDSTNTTSKLGEPVHRKYITYNKNTNDYTLNLDVTGAEGTADGVDVLFVIDTSGSMGKGKGSTYTNLLPTVKNLLNGTNGTTGIVDQILNANAKNAVAYVSFAGVDETKTTDWYTAKNSTTFKNKVNNLKAEGGTNWTYAMQKADSVLRKRTNNNKKVVIFLSDGRPTYSINSWGDEYGHGNATDEAYYTEAIDAVKNSSKLKNVNQFYSVYLTEGTQSGMETFNNGINNTVKGAAIVDGSGNNLGNALSSIINQVIPTYKDVEITDTLSEYVEFTDNPEIAVKMVDANGNETSLSSSDYTLSTTNNSVKVKFNNPLVKGATYTVSFHVKPTQKANDEFSSRGNYPNTGESGTGSTSDGKPGFFSNNSATLTYKVDGTNDHQKTVDYHKPVVQVLQHTLTYKKVWKQPSDVNPTVDSIVLNVNYSDGTSGPVTLNKDDNWTTTENVPVTKTIESVTETTPVADYTASYSYPSSTKAVVTNNYSKVTTNKVKVKKIWEGDGPTETVTVALMQSEINQGIVGEAKELDTKDLTKDNGWSCEWESLVTESSDATSKKHYVYGVVEKNIPAGYQSNIVYDFTDPNATNVIITNTYDEKCADENYYIANVLQTEQLNIRKEWDDNNNVADLRPGALNVTVDGMHFTLNANQNWETSATVLKKKAAIADEQVTEDNIANYQNTGKEITREDSATQVVFHNKLNSKNITVQKIWHDNITDHSGDYVEFKLEGKKVDGTTWKEFGTYNLNEDTTGDAEWTRVIENLPTGYEYRVTETGCSNQNNYVSVVTNVGDTFTITNTLKWSAVKTSADDTNVGLSGAEFELKKDNTLYATGTSGEGGAIEWALASEDVNLYALNGTFKIYETKAPAGYMKNDSGWTVVFENGLLKSLDGTEDGAKIKASAATGVVITLTNQKVYTLPSTGGNGIYWYMIGGMVLMSTAAWILYKNKCREVLGK